MLTSAIRSLARAGRRLIGVDEHARVFDRYYRENGWIGGGSGTGSTSEATLAYRDFLSRFIKEHEIRSVVDAGCGDWQFAKLIDWTGVNYLGLDVSRIVMENTKKYARPGISFAVMNVVNGNLPSADLLIMKDVIQHWSNKDIRRFLPQLQKFRFALIINGTHKGSDKTNIESVTGRCRPVDLTAPPFCIPGEYVFEFQADERKAVFLSKNGL